MKSIKSKMLLLILGCFALSIILCVEIYNRDKGKDSAVGMEEYTGQEGRITRAEIARMMSLLVYTRDELGGLKRNIDYTDTDPSKWYDKYINGFDMMGLAKAEKENNTFRPMAYFTFQECGQLIGNVIVQLETVGSQTDTGELKEKLTSLLSQFADGRKEEDTIGPEEWMEIYYVIFTEGYEAELEETSIYIIDTWENSEQLEKWQTLTDQGILYGDGLNFTEHVDTKHKVYIKGNEIVCIMERLEEEAKLSNVWILEKGELSLKVFVEGLTREFKMAGPIEEDVKNQVGDLIITSGEITKVSIKPDRIKGRVLVNSDGYIEIEGYGKKALSPDFCIYRTYGGISMDKNNSIMVGYENAEFVIVGDEICAAIITEEITAEDIRVLLKTTGFSGYYHEKVTVTSNTKFTITYGKKGAEKKSYKAKKKVTIDMDSPLLKEGRLSIKSKEKDGTITITSIKRNEISPSYEGTIEVTKEEGGLLLVNELSLEHYLYAVVPSEMPTSYGVEALKIQAVCARSYAYKQLLANSLRKYGAHVDDSASYQVYNNIPSNKTAKKAVDATYGEVLRYDNEVITAYYFSTSSGHTANAGEVWNSSANVPYLEGSLQLAKKSKKTEKKVGDLSKEKNFKAFITKDLCTTYDSGSPWYRWKVTISPKKLKNSLEANLLSRYEANPELIRVLGENGEYINQSIGTVGDIEGIEVTKRQTGGIITEIVIKGSEHTVQVQSEYNIRLILAPISSTITRQDGSRVESLSMLPSAFFYIEEKKKDGKVTGYTFTGGGYGHGVGMSQNGAKNMIDRGNTYEDVLKHYYDGIEIGKVY